MGNRLVPCNRCNRHLRNADDVCPFCGASQRRSPRAAVIAASMVAVALAGCGGAQEPPAPVYGPPPTEEPPVAEPPADKPAEDPVEEGEVPPPVEEPKTDSEDPQPTPVVMYGPPPR